MQVGALQALLAAVVTVLMLPGCGSKDSADPPTRRTWVVDRVELPSSAASASSLAFDLDGDTVADDQVGNLLAALVLAGGAGELGLQGAADAAILTGADVILVETLTGSTTSVAFRGGTPAVAPCTVPADLDTCGRHLDGTTHFTAAAPDGPALPGSSSGSTLTAGPGEAVIDLPLLGAPVSLTLRLVHVSLTTTGSTMTGRLGGAISAADIAVTLVPAFASYIAGTVARDCPDGCAAGSDGETLLSLFDADGDGAVTVEELSTNALLGTLLAPDLDLDGDHEADALSFGIGIHLVGAVF